MSTTSTYYTILIGSLCDDILTMLTYMLHQCKQDSHENFECENYFALRLYFTLTTLSSLLLSSFLLARVFHENMQYNNIWVPRATLAFEQDSYMHAILVKTIFQKWYYEKVRPKRTCCSLSRWHSMMSAYPTVGSGI